MLKKIISITAALSLCAALAATASAELNYNNARPTETQTVDFNDSPLGAVADNPTINIHYSGGAVRQNQNKYDKIESSGTTPVIKEGVFGKTAVDNILYAPRTDGDVSKADSFRMEYNNTANGTWIKGYAEGDKIKQSFQIAFDEEVTNAYYYNVQVTGTVDGQNATATIGINNGYTTVFQAGQSSIQFFSKNYPMYFMPSKWYKVEIVYTVGSDTKKNNAKLYIDGEYIASADFTLSKDTNTCVPMYGVVQIRNNLVYRNTNYIEKDPKHDAYPTGVGHYFDDMIWAPMGAAYEYSEIKPVSSNAAVTVTNGAVVLNGAVTAGDVKNAITAAGCTVSVVSKADGTELAADADAEGAMLKITSSVSGDIFYNIGKKLLFEESFEDADGFTEGKPYKHWDVFYSESDSSAAPMMVEKLGGKSGKSFAVNTETEMNKTGWTAVGRMEKTPVPLLVEDAELPLVVELMVNNTQTDYVTGMLRLAYKVPGNNNEKAIESNAITVNSNGGIGVGHKAETGIGDANYQGQWNKVALVINPKTLTLDAYVNGEKRTKEPVAILGSDVTGTIDSITKIYLRTWTGNSKLLDGFTAFDDLKIYQGYYNPSEDAASIVSKDENVVVEKKIIRLAKNFNFTTLKNALEVPVGTTLALYSDDTYKTAYTSILPIQTGVWLVETTPGGAIHYYQIVTPTGKSNYEAPVILVDGIVVDELPAVAEGTTSTIQAVAEMNKFNDTNKTMLALAFYDAEGNLVDLEWGFPKNEGYNRIELNIREIESFEGLTVKAYIWNSVDGMVPVAAMNEVK